MDAILKIDLFAVPDNHQLLCFLARMTRTRSGIWTPSLFSGTAGCTLPLSTTTDQGSLTGVQEAQVLHQEGSSHCPTVRDPGMVPDPTPVVSSASTSASGLPNGGTPCSTAEVVAVSRMEFLRVCLHQCFSAVVADIIISGQCLSSTWQYELCWKIPAVPLWIWQSTHLRGNGL